MFCPKCGEKGGGLCFKCLLEEDPVKIERIKMEVCECGRVKYREKWVEDIVELLPRIAMNAVKFPSGITVREAYVVPKPEKDKLYLDATFTIEYDGKTFKKTLKPKADIVKRTCPSCSKTSAQYFEAVLQVREKNPPIIPENKEISDAKSSKNGVDFHVKSVSYARKIAKKYKRMGYSVSESEKLFGQKNGKSIYRVSFSIKKPPYEVGDIVECNNNLFQVVSLGENTKLMEVKSGISKTSPKSILEKSRLVAKKEKLSNALVSSVTPNETQVMELSSGRVFDIVGSGRFKEGDDVFLLLYHGRVFILKGV